MKRTDKAYWSAWMLLSVFIPMVILSSLHVHSTLPGDGEPCHECIEHTVHNGHITAVKATVDCPLCAFQSNVYQDAQETEPHYSQHVVRLIMDSAVPAIVIGTVTARLSRAPPFTFCA